SVAPYRIDDVLQGLAGQTALHVFGEDLQAADVPAGEDAGAVGRDHDVLHVPERAVGGHGLGIEDVERRAGQTAAVERLFQGRDLDDAAAGDVDQAGAGFHGGKGRHID